jgi:hypothetical protein
VLKCIPCDCETGFGSVPGEFCVDCGTQIQRVIWTGEVWTPSHPDATVLNWLAQCERRMCFPVDSTEDAGFAGFEYAWKVFNHLYQPCGKANDGAMQKARFCLQEYLNAEEFADRERHSINSLCHYVLHDDPEYMEDTRITIDLPEQDDDRTRTILRRATNHCKHVRKALKSRKHIDALVGTVRTLYELRNARIHGDIIAGTEKVGKPRVSSVEFGTVLGLLVNLDIAVLAGKSRAPQETIRDLITSRTLQLVREIHTRATNWVLPSDTLKC